MKTAGLITAVDELLIHPEHATAPRLLLSGLLLMGGQATKDLIFGLVDRIMAQGEHHSQGEPPGRDGHDGHGGPAGVSDLEERRRRRSG